MKTLSLFALISLAVAAAAQQQDHRGGFGGNRGFGNNGNNNNGFGRNRNGNNGNNANNNGNANGNPNGNGTAASAAAASSVAVAATSASAAVNTAASNTVASSAASSTSASTSSSNSTASNSGNEQSSLTLDPNAVATGFENNGQGVQEAGQVASLTSSNNFINFCLLTLPNTPLTNGKQITTGSCNPAPMGLIPSTSNMPSAKFQVPKNGDVIPVDTAFTITMAVQGFETGNFVNAQENYFAAPQQLNSQGQVIGHSHVVVEQLTSLDQTTPTNPQVFAFFKGLNAAAVNGVLTADVANGLPAGTYKVSSINTAANHQPILVPIAQHGSLDDAVYFTVSGSNSTAAAGSSSTDTAAAAAGTDASAAPAAAAVPAAAASAAPAAASAAANTAVPAAGQANNNGNQANTNNGNQRQQFGGQRGGGRRFRRDHPRSFA
jgi:hypothetical protein